MLVPETAGENQATNNETYPALYEHRELVSLIDESPLPMIDKRYAWTIIAQRPPHPDLIPSLNQLVSIANTEPARRKIEERQRAEIVNIKDFTSLYTPAQLALIIPRIHSYQMTDGCTVGCSFCAFLAQNHVTAKFGCDSFAAYLQEFSRYLPGVVTAYYRSDPYDVDYVDIFSVINEYTQIPFTCTAVPLGTELTIVRHLEMIFRAWEESALSDGISLSEEDPVGKIFRFSGTQANSERIELILSLLKSLGVNQEFIGGISIVDRNQEAGISRAGRAINNPNLDLLKDSLGIATCDCVYISPKGGMVATFMESATKESPTGTREIPLDPKQLVLPVLIDRFKYSINLSKPFSPDVFGKLFRLLPEITCEVYNPEGRLLETRIIPSTRRDTFTFDLLLNHYYALKNPELRKYWTDHPEVKQMLSDRFIEEFLPEYERRKRNCLDRLPQETDKEAAEIARAFIEEIDGYNRMILKEAD